MKYWKDFLDSIDSPGGHILLFISLLYLGYHFGSMEIQAGAFGALLRGVSQVKSNREQAAAQPPTA